MRQSGFNKLKSLIRWLNVENLLLSKILERNFMQHRKQLFLRYTKIALKSSIEFTKALKSNIKLIQNNQKCSICDLNQLSDRSIKMIIRAGVKLSRIHAHRHFTQLITTLIACLSRLHLLIKKWQLSTISTGANDFNDEAKECENM